MAFDAMGAFAAAAAGGEGFYQGYDQAQNRQYMQQMRGLSVQEAQADLAAKQRIEDQQRNLSADAVREFNPGQGTPGQQLSNAAGGGGTAQSSDDFAQKFTDMANAAFARGDLTGGGQALTMAQNLRSEQAVQQQKQAAIRTASLKSDIQDLQYVAQAFNGTQNDPAGFERVKMQLLSNPDISDRERQNISQFHYSPQLVDQIVNHGQTVAQQKQEQLRQLQIQTTQQHDAFIEQNDSARTAIQQARLTLEQQRAQNGTKVGVVKAPTDNDINQAIPATKSVMGDDVDTKSQAFNDANQAIASRALAIAAQNRGMSYDQAASQAAEEFKRSGAFGTKQIPAKYATILGKELPFETSPAKTQQTFQPKGQTKDSAIAVPAKESDLVDGQYYKNAKGQVAQWKDGQFVPVK